MKKMRFEKRERKRGAIAIEEVGWWILAAVLLVILVGAIIFLSGTGRGIIEKFKELLMFGK